MIDTAHSTPAAEQPGRQHAIDVLKKLAIWGLFFSLIYIARDFFFIAFMVFLFCYLILAVVGWTMTRLSPDRERPGLRRLVVVGLFVLTPVVLLGIGLLAGPRLVGQGQRLAGWLGHVSPEGEVARLLQGYVGPSEFKQEFGGPDDPRYVQALEEFRKTGERHVAAYNEFPHLETWIEAGFRKEFLEAEGSRIRHRLAQEGTSSQAFADWFVKVEVPQLKALAQQQAAEQARPTGPLAPLVRTALSSSPEQLLKEARYDPAALTVLRQAWIDDTVAQDLSAAKGSATYRERFRGYFERQRAQSPASIPYTFDQYIELQEARSQGPRAFGDTLEKLLPTEEGAGPARLRADFEAAKKHELFQEWWGSSSTASFIRHQLATRFAGGGPSRVEHIVSSVINLPIDLSTALLISFFICIDFPTLRHAGRRLRDTWLRDVYDELVPALGSLGEITGRALRAQAMIALCNATMIFLALWMLGVEHPLLLSGATAVLCLVPTLGMVIAWVLIAAVALMQPGGGLMLAVQMSGAVAFVVLMETFVFSPRIVGRMMELHPVLLMSLLPLAQYFFGVWGLILATPVAVYVVHVLILRRGLPGRRIAGETHEQQGQTTSAGTAVGPAPAESSEKELAVVTP